MFVWLASPMMVLAQQVTVPSPSEPAPPASAAATPPPMPAGVTLPADYVIGPDDMLAIVFWREKDMSSDVQVRSDGKITLPLLNDIQAAGLTPDQLREEVTKAANKFVEEPTVTIIVKAMNSRKVFVTGQVLKPGQFVLVAPTTVMQLIAMAGGLQEYADKSNIVVLRTEGDQQVAHRFNYEDIMKRKNLKQNIVLKPGDTVIVP
jgi:polysaccharide export outer membrane protein